MPVYGKLPLLPHLQKFISKHENIENNTLDLSQPSPMRNFICDLLVGKKEFLQSGALNASSAYSAQIKLKVPLRKEAAMRIYLTPKSIKKINTHFAVLFKDYANFYVKCRALHKVSVEEALVEFLLMHDLETDEFPIDNFKRENTRINERRNFSLRKFKQRPFKIKEPTLFLFEREKTTKTEPKKRKKVAY